MSSESSFDRQVFYELDDLLPKPFSSDTDSEDSDLESPSSTISPQALPPTVPTSSQTSTQGSRTLFSLLKLHQLKVQIVHEGGNVWVALANGSAPEGTKLVFLILERIPQTNFPIVPSIRCINSVNPTHT